MRHNATFLAIVMTCVIMGISAGCLPAQSPPQLAFTPGAPITITEDEFLTGAFVVKIPAGWRVVTSPAENPPSVIFVAPDDSALIFIAADPNLPAPEFTGSSEVPLREYTANHEGIYGTLIAETDVYVSLFEEIVNTASPR